MQIQSPVGLMARDAVHRPNHIPCFPWRTASRLMHWLVSRGEPAFYILYRRKVCIDYKELTQGKG